MFETTIKFKSAVPGLTLVEILSRLVHWDYGHDDIRNEMSMSDAQSIHNFVHELHMVDTTQLERVGTPSLGQPDGKLLSEGSALTEAEIQKVRSIVQFYEEGPMFVRNVPEPRCDLPRGPLDDFLLEDETHSGG